MENIRRSKRIGPLRLVQHSSCCTDWHLRRLIHRIHGHIYKVSLLLRTLFLFEFVVQWRRHVRSTQAPGGPLRFVGYFLSMLVVNVVAVEQGLHLGNFFPEY